MNKILFCLFTLAALFTVSCGVTQKARKGGTSQHSSLDGQIDSIAGQIIGNLSVEKKATIAVIEFADLQGGANGFGRFLSEELITRLFKSSQFKVVERQLINKVVDEHKLNVSGMIDEETAKEFGYILGVDAIVTGSVTDLGKSVKVNARLIATETGAIFAVASGEIAKDDKVAMLMGGGGKAVPSDDLFLSMPMLREKIGWGTLHINKSVEGNRLKINGYTFEKGIGTHANSELWWELGRSYSLFSGKVGHDDESRCGDGVLFRIYVDPVGDLKSWDLKWTSRTHKYGSDPEAFSLDVKDAYNLRVSVDRLKNGKCDHADIVEPVLK